MWPSHTILHLCAQVCMCLCAFLGRQCRTAYIFGDQDFLTVKRGASGKPHPSWVKWKWVKAPAYFLKLIYQFIYRFYLFLKHIQLINVFTQVYIWIHPNYFTDHTDHILGLLCKVALDMTIGWKCPHDQDIYTYIVNEFVFFLSAYMEAEYPQHVLHEPPTQMCGWLE